MTVHPTIESNMKKIIIPLCFLISCKATRNINTYLPVPKQLEYLHSYKKSNDSVNNKIRIFYPELSLIQERTTDSFFFYLRNQKVFEANTKNDYLLEIFNKTFLVISIDEKNRHPAGPDLFNRDLLNIVDLHSGKVIKASLKNINLTRSSDFLKANYNFKTVNELQELGNQYCAIDSISAEDNFMLLLNQNHKIIKLPTVPVPIFSKRSG